IVTTKFGFFFGAGAEACYGMPLGPEYTLQSMVQKNSRLFEALGTFYENRITNEYAGTYQKIFMFDKESNTFCDIMLRAAKACIGNKNIDTLSQKVIDAYFDDSLNKDDYEAARKNFKQAYSDAYDS